MKNPNDPVAVQNQSNIFVQTERAYGFSAAQLKVLSGEYYDHIVRSQLPVWSKWTISVSGSVLSFCLPFTITKVEINDLGPINESLIRSTISFFFRASLITFTISAIVIIIHLIRQRGLIIPREAAIRWFITKARKRNKSIISINPNEGLPLDH